jgi:hypothetical protein
MKKMFIFMPIISYLLLSAHFFRAGNLYLSIISIIFPILLLIKNRFIPFIVQLGLIFGVFVWIKTFFKFLHIYQRFHMPFTKAGAIIASVALFTFISIFVFNIRTIRQRYSEEE